MLAARTIAAGDCVCVGAGIIAMSRISCFMAEPGRLPEPLGCACPNVGTPHLANCLDAHLSLLLAAPWIVGATTYDGEGISGTLHASGLLAAALLIVAVAPRCMHRIGALTLSSAAAEGSGVVFVVVLFTSLIGVIGSGLFSLPAFLETCLICAFFAFMVAGFGWLFAPLNLRSESIEHVIDSRG